MSPFYKISIFYTIIYSSVSEYKCDLDFLKSSLRYFFLNNSKDQNIDWYKCTEVKQK